MSTPVWTLHIFQRLHYRPNCSFIANINPLLKDSQNTDTTYSQMLFITVIN